MNEVYNDVAPEYEDFAQSVLYKQMSYEELEECVLDVRDSIAEFYLAPQGEISFAAVDAAIRDKMGVPAAGPAAQYGHASARQDDAGFLYDAPGQIFAQGDGAAIAQAGEYAADIGLLTAAAGDIEVPAEGANTERAATGDAANAENEEYGGEGPGELLGIDAVRGAGRLRLVQSQTASLRQIYRESINNRNKRRRTRIFKFVFACSAGAIAGGLLVLVCAAFVLPAIGVSLYPASPDKIHEVVYSYEYVKTDTQIEAIYEKVSPSVVGIRVSSGYGGDAFGGRRQIGDGSGIIIHSDGYILTSNTAVSSQAWLYAPVPGDGGDDDPGMRGGVRVEAVIQRDPGTAYQAKLIARDVKADLAIIKIEAAGLPVAEFGDSDDLRPGELVVAIGRPGWMNDACSIADGIVSGFNPEVSSHIRTNAAIDYGNIGGALVNARGLIIGVNVITAEPAGGGGAGFAIPINSARAIAETLINYNAARGRPKTGIRYSASFNENFEIYKQQFPDIPEGAYVEYVEPLSGAFKAGIRTGDIITNLCGEPVSNYMDFIAIKETVAPGDVIEVEVFRTGEYHTLELEVSEETDESPDTE